MPAKPVDRDGVDERVDARDVVLRPIGCKVQVVRHAIADGVDEVANEFVEEPQTKERANQDEQAARGTLLLADLLDFHLVLFFFLLLLLFLRGFGACVAVAGGFSCNRGDLTEKHST